MQKSHSLIGSIRVIRRLCGRLSDQFALFVGVWDIIGRQRFR